MREIITKIDNPKAEDPTLKTKKASIDVWVAEEESWRWHKE